MLFANIFTRFDVDFDPSQDPKAFIEGVKDCQTWLVPELKLRFTPANAVKA